VWTGTQSVQQTPTNSPHGQSWRDRRSQPPLPGHRFHVEGVTWSAEWGRTVRPRQASPSACSRRTGETVKPRSSWAGPRMAGLTNAERGSASELHGFRSARSGIEAWDAGREYYPQMSPALRNYGGGSNPPLGSGKNLTQSRSSPSHDRRRVCLCAVPGRTLKGLQCDPLLRGAESTLLIGQFRGRTDDNRTAGDLYRASISIRPIRAVATHPRFT